MDKFKIKSCKCGKKNGMTCSNCSRYRLVIYIKDEYLYLFPEITPNFKGKAFYSRIKFNNYSFMSVLRYTSEKLKDIKKEDYKMALKYAKKVLFYDNFNGGAGYDLTNEILTK